MKHYQSKITNEENSLALRQDKSPDTVCLGDHQTPPASVSSSFAQLKQLNSSIGNRAMGMLLQAKFSQSTPNLAIQTKPSHQCGLPADVQSQMESAFQADFSGVKIHTNSSNAVKVNALAYTQGHNIHFAPGQFNPNTSAGKYLIGHELAHVVQQSQGRVLPTSDVSGMPVNDNPALEREADQQSAEALKHKPNTGGQFYKAKHDGENLAVGKNTNSLQYQTKRISLENQQGSKESINKPESKKSEMASIPQVPSGDQEKIGVTNAPQLSGMAAGHSQKKARLNSPSSASIQRKIGFEMEYAIPLSTPSEADLNILSYDTATNRAKRNMCTYLTGGPSYDNDRHIASGSKYKVHIDHELELQRAHVQLVTRLMNDRMMGAWRRADHNMIAIPEYVTDAFDEMGAYSTNTIRSTLTAISANMQLAFAAAQNGLGAFPGANGFYVGVPSQDFKDYYDRHHKDKTQLNPILTRIENAIQDRIAPQATVGIIPSSIFKAHQKLLTESRMTTDRDDAAISGTDALRLSIDYTVDVMELIERNQAFSNLKQQNRIAWDELKGLVTLITNYIIGEAYYRSSGFEDYKTVKNAVPLMSKIWLHTVINSAPSLKQQLTDPMIQTLTNTIRRHPLYNPDRVRQSMHVNLRTHKLSGTALAADSTMLNSTSTNQLIAGMLNNQAFDHRGQRFAGPDRMIAAIRNASDNQSGIPLEYRRLNIRPNAAGLLDALWPLVEESRELNMRHMTLAQRQNTLWWADTSRTEAASYYAGRALQGLRSAANWGWGLLPSW